MKKICNVAIIAHVDHGKTTMIDSILRQSGAFRDNQVTAERMMDSNDLEQEKKITISAKYTSVDWKDIKFNIIDTPGHKDFSGEVERVLSMANGVLLLVDSSEGVMPQTRFVLSKALKSGLKPIVIVNKVDRPDARISEVLDEIFDLFLMLEADDEQLNFPTLYASGRDGWCVTDLDNEERKDLSPLFDCMTDYLKPKEPDCSQPFSMLVTLLGHDQFLGKMLIGKVQSGIARINSNIRAMDRHSNVKAQGKLTKLFTFCGVKKIPIDEAVAGDIVAVAGIPEASVTDTIADESITEAIPSDPIDPPTLSVTIGVNDSPLAGTDGSKLTSRVIYDRLKQEEEINISIQVKELEGKESFQLNGRGELQIGVLLETMRREGFELSVSRPKVIFRTDEKGNKLEPIEEVTIDVDEEFSGTIIEKISYRKGELQESKTNTFGKTRLTFLAPARCLIGYSNEFMTDTRGTGVMNKIFHSYEPFKGELKGRTNGVLIATEAGKAVSYALCNIQERGKLFISPQEPVYGGMIIGLHSRDSDLEVNATKTKQLTNMRSSSADENIKLVPPIKMTLEAMISFIEDDELVEITPSQLRLRKKYLDPNERKRHSRGSKK